MNRDNSQSLAKMEKAILAKLTPQIINSVRETVHLVLADAPKAQPGKTTRRASRNGVTEPIAGGKCDAIWQALDKLVKNSGGMIPKVTQIMELARGEGMNEGNARCEYYLWRRFHGYGKKSSTRGKQAKKTA